MRVRNLTDGIEMDRICPNRIHAEIRLTAWDNYIIQKCYLFTFLVKCIILVNILQSKNMIASGGYSFNDEFSASIGAGNTFKRLLHEGRIFQITVQAN